MKIWKTANVEPRRSRHASAEKIPLATPAAASPKASAPSKEGEQIAQNKDPAQALRLLRHAAECEDDRCPDTECAGTKRLWQHIVECQDVQCPFPDCVVFRRMVQHRIRCKMHNVLHVIGHLRVSQRPKSGTFQQNCQSRSQRRKKTYFAAVCQISGFDPKRRRGRRRSCNARSTLAASGSGKTGFGAAVSRISCFQEEDGEEEGDTMQQQPVEARNQSLMQQEQPAKKQVSVQEAEEAEEEGDSMQQPASVEDQASLQQQAAEAAGGAMQHKQPPLKAGKQALMQQQQQPPTSEEEASMQSKAAEAEKTVLLQQPTKATEQASMKQQEGVRQAPIQKPSVKYLASMQQPRQVEQTLMEQQQVVKQVLIQQQRSECQVMMQQQQLAKTDQLELRKQEQHEENQGLMQRLQSRGVDIVVGPVLIEIAESGSIRISTSEERS